MRSTELRAAALVALSLTVFSGCGGGGHHSFLAFPAPTVTSIAPNTGPASGGTTVTVTGSGFDSVTIITLGGIPLVGQSLSGTSQITGKTPPSATIGAVDVSATNAFGTGTLKGGFTFTNPITVDPASTVTTPVSTATADGASTITFTVTVKDTAGVPVPGATVTVTASGVGNVISSPVTANASGVATITVTSTVAQTETLTFVVNGVTLTTKPSVTFTPGAATQIAFVTQPGNVTAGGLISCAVAFEDAHGNVAPTSTGSINIVIGTNPTGAALGGTTPVVAQSGVASFTNLTITKSSALGYTLTATATGFPTATSSAFTVSPGAATQLQFTQPPTNVNPGTPISPAITVAALDQFGNTATSFTGNVTLGFGANPGGSTLSGTNPQPAVAGVATFNNISLNNAGNNYTLTAAAAGLTGTTSPTFNVSGVGVPAKLAFVQPPTDAQSQAAMVPAVTVRILDSQNNQVNVGGVPITLSIQTNAGGNGILTGGGATNTDAGPTFVSTFSALSIDKVGSGYTLIATSPGLTSVVSGTFNITPGNPATLVFTKQPSNTAPATVITPAVVVTVLDAAGNTATQFTGPVAMTVSAGGTLGGTTPVTAAAGVATFSDLTVMPAASGYTLTASINAGAITQVSNTFNITGAGIASKLRFTSEPMTSQAGSTITTFTVEVDDVNGTIVTSPNVSVTLGFTAGGNPGGSTISGTNPVTTSNGVATFSNISLNKAGTGYQFTASSAGLTTATSTAFDIQPGAASQLVFLVDPGNTTAGVTIAPAIQVAVEDANNNVVTSSSASVTLNVASGTGTIVGTNPVSAVSGVATFNIDITKASTDTFTASASGLPTTAPTPSFTISPAATKTFTVTGYPANTNADTTSVITVTAIDQFGNTTPAYAGTVTFSDNPTSANDTIPANSTLTNGVGTFNFRMTKPTANGTITATDTVTATITGQETGIVVAPGAAKSLSVTGFPQVTNADTTSLVTVTALDQWGNTATGYAGTVTFSDNPHSANDTIPANSTLVNGTKNFNFRITTPVGAAGSITATDTVTATITGTEAGITVASGATTKFTVTGYPVNTNADTTSVVTVTAQDQWGNTTPAYTGTVHFTDNPTSANDTIPANSTLVNGTMNFNFRITKPTANGTITATDTVTATITGSETGIVVAPGATKTLSVTGYPKNTNADTTSPITVTALDQWLNTATGYAGTVTFSDSPHSANDTIPANSGLVNGVGNFNVRMTLPTGAGSITATDTVTGTITGTESGITVVAGAAKTLTVTGYPANTNADTTSVITVTALDQWLNTATGYAGTVHFTDSPTSANDTIPANSTLVNGTKNFNFRITTPTNAGSITATDTVTATITGTESGITVAPGAATHLTVTGYPVNTNADTTSVITVTALDQWNNTATGYAGTVTFTDNPTSANDTIPANSGLVNGTKNFNFRITTPTNAGKITATDTVTATITGSESAIVVAPGAATHLTVTGYPTNTNADTTSVITVTAFDQWNNTATGYGGTVHLTDSPTSGNDTIPANSTLVNGTKNFNFRITTPTNAGSITATDTVTATITGTENGITVAPGATKKLAVTGYPANTNADTTSVITVTAQDQWGNTTPAYGGTVHFTDSPTSANDTIPANSTLTAGTKNFNFRITTPTNAGTITATDTVTGTITGTEGGITVVAGAATHLTVTGYPANTNADTTSVITVTAFDQWNNTATGYGGTVHFTDSPTSGNDTIPANSGLVNGTKNFNFRITTPTNAGSITATDTVTGTITGTESGITVVPGAAKTLTVTGYPLNTNADTTSVITVTALDQWLNTATGYTGTVHFTDSPTSANDTIPANSTLVNGTKTFNFRITTPTNAGSITATDTVTLTITGTESGITVAPGAATHLTVTGYPVNTNADTTSVITVTAFDQWNNTATGYGGTVTFTDSPTSANDTIPANSGLVNGTKNFNFRITTPTNAGKITATDTLVGTITGSESAIVVAPGAATHLAVTGYPTNTNADTTSVVTVTAKDQWNNTATAYGGTVHFTNSPSSGNDTVPADSTLTAGTKNFNYRITTPVAAGAGSITATDTVNPAINGTENGITVGPGALNRFAVVVTGPVTAGNATTFTVTAQDQWLNTATGYAGQITETCTDGKATFTTNPYTFVPGTDNGVHTFTNGVTLKTAGAQNVNVTDGAGHNGSGAVTVNPAAYTAIGFIQQPTSVAPNQNMVPAVTVALQDAFGNTETGTSDSITLTIDVNPGGATLSNGGSTGTVNGVATFSSLQFSNNQASGYTLLATATTSGFTVQSLAFAVGGAGVPAKLAFLQNPTNAQDTVSISPSITVQVQDVFNNPVTGNTSNITLAILNNAGGGTLSGTLTQPANGGTTSTATFAGLSIDKVGNGYTLQATDGSLTAATSTGFNITLGPPAHLAFLQQPPPSVNGGITMSPALTVQVLDAGFNLITSGAGSADMIQLGFQANPGGGTLTGGSAVAASGGIATFAGVSVDKAANNYQLNAHDNTTGIPNATSNFFNVTVGPATHMQFAPGPSNTTGGVTFTPTVKVQLLDAGNNLTSQSDNIALSIANNAGGGTLFNGGPFAASGGVASFPSANIDKVGTGYTIQAHDSTNGLPDITSGTFNVTLGPANKLVFLQNPTNTNGGAIISPPVTVQITDAGGNPTNSGSNQVTLTIGNNPGTPPGALSGNTQVNCVSGLATFNNLSINSNGSGYTLVATGAGIPNTGTSNSFNIGIGPPVALAFKPAPSAAQSGASIGGGTGFSVAIVDAGGNTVTAAPSANILIAIASGTNLGPCIPGITPTLSGPNNQSTTSGVATFSGASINEAGTYTLLATTSAGYTPVKSGAFNITAGNASDIAFTGQPTNTNLNSTMAPAVKVQIVDGAGNYVPQSGTMIGLTLGNPGPATLANGGAVSTDANGTATFANLSVNATANNYFLQASGGGFSANSNNFNIQTSGSQSQLVFTVQPFNATAGQPIGGPQGVQVSVTDASGNVIFGANNSITIAINQNPSSGTLSGTTTQNAVNGTAFFPNLSIDKTGFGYSLQATSTGLNTALSQNIQIFSDFATQLAFTQQPSSTAPGATMKPSVLVQIEDQFGNAASEPNNTFVALAIGSNPGGSTLTGGAARQTDFSGRAIFAGLSLNNSGSPYTLIASNAVYPNVTSTNFSIQPAGAATHLVFTNEPNQTTSNQIIDQNSGFVQVSVADANGIIVPTDTSNITVSIASNPASGSLGGTVTVQASAGTATFTNLTIDKAGFPYTLQATDGLLANATSVQFGISPGAAQQLQFSQNPSNAAPGQNIVPTVQVQLLDGAGNVTTFPQTNVTLSLVGAGGGTLNNFGPVLTDFNGVATFPTLNVTGGTLPSSYQLQTSNDQTLLDTTSNGFTIENAGPADHLIFVSSIQQTTAGQPINGPSGGIQVAIVDMNGIVVNSNDTISLSLQSNPTNATLNGTTSLAATNGIATFANANSANITVAGGAYTIDAHDGGLPHTDVVSNGFQVNSGDADHLFFLQQPSNTGVGATIAPAVVVQLQDSFGNFTSFPTTSVSMALAVGSPSGTLSGGGATNTDNNGQATFSNLSINQAGNNFQLQATGQGLNNPQQDSSFFNIANPGTPSQLRFLVSPNGTQAGQPIGNGSQKVSVAITDSNGIVESGDNTHTITIALGQNPTNATLNGTTTLTVVNGVATFNVNITQASNFSYTLTATTNAFSFNLQSGFFNIFPGPTTQLVFSPQAPNGQPNSNLVPAVQVIMADQFGNNTGGSGTNITLSVNSGPGTLTGGGPVATNNGTATFSSVQLSTAGTYSLNASASPGGFTGTSNSLTIFASPGPAANVIFAVQPPSLINAGQNFTVQAAVTDANGVVVTSGTGSTDSITIAIASNPNNGSLGGTVTTNAVNGIATFSTLFINQAGFPYTLTATDNTRTLTVATSNQFQIQPGAATGIKFFDPPQNGPPAPATLQGQGGPITVGYVDVFGNGTGAPGGFGGGEQITMSLAAGPGGTLGGSGFTQPSNNGSAQFTSLTISAAGNGYQLKATSSPSNFTVTSSTFNVQSVVLVWILPPANYTVNKLMRPPTPTVQLQDGHGNPVTGQNLNVTVSLQNGGAANLTGDLTVSTNSNNGIAMFENLSIDTVNTGNTYQLVASAPGATSGTSNTFNIEAAPAWTLVNNAAITGGEVNQFAIDTSTTPHTIYVAQSDGIYVSANGGTSWTNTTSNITDTGVVSVAVDAQSANKAVYVLAPDTGVWVSTLHGATGSWTRTLPLTIAGQGNNDFGTLVTTSAAGTVYLFLQNQLYLTTNSGTMWSRQNATNLPTGGFGGNSNTALTPIAVLPGSSTTVFVGEGGNSSPATVWESTDSGGSFTNVTASGLPSSDSVTALAIDSGGANIYVATAQNGVFQAALSGLPNLAFSAFGTGLTPNFNEIDALEVDPSLATTLYVCATSSQGGGPGSNGLFQKTSASGAWSQLASTTLPTFIDEPVAVLCDPASGSPSQTIFTGVQGPGIFMSSNGGTSFSAARSGTTAPEVFQVAVDPSNSSFVYAITDNRVFVSNNGGTNASWSLNTPAGVNLCLGIAVDTVGKVYVGTDQGIFFAAQGIPSGWTQTNAASVTLLSGAFALVPAVNPANNHVFVGNFTKNSELYESTDGGTSFTALDPTFGGASQVQVGQILFDNGNLYAICQPKSGGNTGIYVSSNFESGAGNVTFSALTNGLSLQKADPSQTILTVDGSHNLYLADRDNGIFKLPSGQTTWVNADPNHNLPSGNTAASVAYSPTTTTGPIYIWSTQGNGGGGDNFGEEGVWVSNDGGNSWAPATDGLFSGRRANGIFADPHNHTAGAQRLFVATQDFGLWITNSGGGP